MYKNIVVAIDLNDEVSCRKPLVSAVKLARAFDARLYVLIVHGLAASGTSQTTSTDTMPLSRLSRTPCSSSSTGRW